MSERVPPFPCRDCDHRQIGCHGSCEVYQKVRKLKDEENARLHREKEAKRIIASAFFRKNMKRKERWK